MSNLEDIWIPLVDEPIGSIVAEIQREHPEIDRLVSTPHRVLAFRTFAYIRVGLVLGVAAGVLSGLFGVGGGILFVPALLALGLSQLHAEATSLAAILPTAGAGVWRQQRYGNVQWRAAIVIGIASVGGVEAGVQVATSLPETTLRRLFAVLVFLVAANIAWRRRNG